MHNSNVDAAQTFNEETAPTTGANNAQKINISPNTRYRLRFINMSAFSRYYIWIQGGDDKDLEVIEIDGVMLKLGSPGETTHVTRGIELAPGQRVSVVTGIPSSQSLRRIMVRLFPANHICFTNG
jgi:FtsP/CotA-like multicopper oxidase with cupredoxin domain